MSYAVHVGWHVLGDDAYFSMKLGVHPSGWSTRLGYMMSFSSLKGVMFTCATHNANNPSA